MRRYLPILLAGILMVGLSAPVASARMSLDRRFETVRYRTLQRPLNRDSKDEVRKMIRAAVARMSVPGGVAKALSVAECESNFTQFAGRGDSDPYRGIYQHHTGYWPGRVAGYRQAHPRGDITIRAGASVYSARANVLVSIWMAHRNGWGPWSCA